MITDLDLARAAIDTYRPDIQPTWNTADVHAYLSHIDGCAVIAFEGSRSGNDWVRDFLAIPVHEAFEHVELGLTHLAFAQDVEEIFDQIIAGLPDDPVAVCGHSKGGGEGQDFAALFHARFPQRNLVRLTTIGAPRVGLLNGLLRDIPGNDYHNCPIGYMDDPVPDFPTYFDHPRAITNVNAPPLPDDPWGPLAAHHGLLYIQGVAGYLASKVMHA